MNPTMTCEPAMQRAAQTEQKPFPGMLALAHEILADDVFAAGGYDHAQAFGQFTKHVVKGRAAAEDAQRQQEHREKSQEHIEGDGLAQIQAIRENAAQAAIEIFEERIHRIWLAIIRSAGQFPLNL